MAAKPSRPLYAGWAVSGLLILAGCQAGPATSTDTVDDSAASASVSVLELEVGTCLNDVDQPLAQDLTEIPSVSCTEPHQSEVFAEVVLEGGDFPGVDEVASVATTECMAEFGRFVGLDFSASQLNYHYYYPTASSWALGDRSIYCVVFDPGQETVGSLQGVAR